MTRFSGADIPSRETVQADVCIIGTGPAAFTLALDFVEQSDRERPLRVVMLESQASVPAHDRAFGGRCDTTQLFYPGVAAGLLGDGRTRSYLLDRLRVLGGGTSRNHWGGWGWPLKPWDLESRRYHRSGRWPITYDDLKPHYEKIVESVMQMDPFEFDNPDYWIRTYGTNSRPLETMNTDDSELTTEILQFAQIDFALEYAGVIQGSEHVDLYTNANATVFDLAPDGDRKRATRLRVRSLDASCTPTTEWYVEADRYVVCCGGLESTRFLLLNDLGNQSDQLGRYFMDHFYATSVGPFDLDTQATPLGVQNFYFSAFPVSARSRLQFIAAVIPRETWIDSHPDSGNFTALLGSQLRQNGRFRTWIMAEDQPNPDSRITLTDEVPPDVFGQPRMKVDWRALDGGRDGTHALRAAIDLTRDLIVDKRCYARNYDALEGYDTDLWPDWGDNAVTPGLHSMGATRMSADPAGGVVDANLRVHDTSNVHVASSSVFPTGAGYQNPTFTICALSSRLAGHLKSTLS